MANGLWILDAGRKLETSRRVVDGASDVARPQTRSRARRRGTRPPCSARAFARTPRSESRAPGSLVPAARVVGVERELCSEPSRRPRRFRTARRPRALSRLSASAQDVADAKRTDPRLFRPVAPRASSARRRCRGSCADRPARRGRRCSPSRRRCCSAHALGSRRAPSSSAIASASPPIRIASSAPAGEHEEAGDCCS